MGLDTWDQTLRFFHKDLYKRFVLLDRRFISLYPPQCKFWFYSDTLKCVFGCSVFISVEGWGGHRTEKVSPPQGAIK